MHGQVFVMTPQSQWSDGCHFGMSPVVTGRLPIEDWKNYNSKRRSNLWKLYGIVSIGVASFPKFSGPEMPSLMSTAEVPDDCVSKLNVSCEI